MMRILDRLADMHRVGLLHRDVKPQNVLLANDLAGGERSSVWAVWAVDFGLVKPFRNRHGVHIPHRGDKPGLTGTPRFAPTFAQVGHESSRRDDIESLLFVAGDRQTTSIYTYASVHARCTQVTSYLVSGEESRVVPCPKIGTSRVVLRARLHRAASRLLPGHASNSRTQLQLFFEFVLKLYYRREAQKVLHHAGFSIMDDLLDDDM